MSAEALINFGSEESADVPAKTAAYRIAVEIAFVIKYRRNIRAPLSHVNTFLIKARRCVRLKSFGLAIAVVVKGCMPAERRNHVRLSVPVLCA